MLYCTKSFPNVVYNSYNPLYISSIVFLNGIYSFKLYFKVLERQFAFTCERQYIVDSDKLTYHNLISPFTNIPV